MKLQEENVYNYLLDLHQKLGDNSYLYVKSLRDKHKVNAAISSILQSEGIIKKESRCHYTYIGQKPTIQMAKYIYKKCCDYSNNRYNVSKKYSQPKQLKKTQSQPKKPIETIEVSILWGLYKYTKNKTK